MRRLPDDVQNLAAGEPDGRVGHRFRAGSQERTGMKTPISALLAGCALLLSSAGTASADAVIAVLPGPPVFALVAGAVAAALAIGRLRK
jgi:hypothetical protein